MTKLAALWYLVLFLMTSGQDDLLSEKVTVNFQQQPLLEVLKNLHTQHGLNFSYADQMIPLQSKVTVSIQNQPLKLVVERICQQTNTQFQVVGNQLVLTPATEVDKAPIQNTTPPVKQKEQVDTKAQTSKIAESEDQMTASTATTLNVDTVQLEDKEPESDDKNQNNQVLASAASENDNVQDSLSLEAADPETTKEPTALMESTRPEVKRQRSVNAASGNYEVRPFQVGFIHPLSTNGMEAGRIVNNVSLNVLAGYSAGLDGVEFSGFANVEKDFVKGVQFAGFSNLVKNKVEGAQFGGFMNLVGGTLDGGQFAGFTNINSGYTKGAQFAGFANIVTDSSFAFQAAGFGNFNTLDSKGLQAAGFINTSRDHRGSQLAGFTNIARGDVTGFQAAGFLNVARKVTGSQLSVFNYADSVTGVPVGFLSIVRHGYHHLEVWGSESMHTNLALKIGVERFYNIFAGGVHLDPNNFHWGFGYGVGSQLDLSRSVKLNLDAITMTLFNDRHKIRNWEYLNLHNQFRILFGWEIASHFSIYAGPTFNLLVSDVALNPENQTATSIAPYSFYDRTFKNTNVKMWAGLNFGIRF